MTAISFPEKKKPSQVAHDETPCPINAFSPGQSQPACRCPAGDNQGAGVNRLLAKIHREGPLAQINADHMAQLILRPKASRLLAHVLNQLGTLNALGKPGKILHQRGERELASGLMAFNHQGLEVGAGGVERRGMAGATGPNDDNVANVLHIDVQPTRAALDCQIQIWMQGPRSAGVPPSAAPLFLLRRRLLRGRRPLCLLLRHPGDPLELIRHRGSSAQQTPIV